MKNVSSLQSEAVEEKLYKAPSSPEDGEITDENSNPSDVEVRLSQLYYINFWFYMMLNYIYSNLKIIYIYGFKA